MIGSPATLAYEHRGQEVVDRLRALHLGEIVAELELLFSVTT